MYNIKNRLTMNNIYRFLFLLIMFVSAQVAVAQHTSLSIYDGDTLKLIKVGTSTKQIKIDGVWRTRGYNFTPDKSIELDKGEYIVVTDLTQGIFNITICGNELIETNASTVERFIHTKGARTKGSDGFGKFLSSFTWYIVEDTLYIPTKYLLDNDHGFLLKPIPGNDFLKCPINFDPPTNELVLTKTYFEDSCNFPLTPGLKYQFRVEYWNKDEFVEFITDKFFVEYILKF